MWARGMVWQFLAAQGGRAERRDGGGVTMCMLMYLLSGGFTYG